MNELTEIKREILELNYEMSLAMRYNDVDKIRTLRERTNRLISIYLKKIAVKVD